MSVELEQAEMGRRLTAFADATLRPDPAAVARIRQFLVIEATARVAAASRPTPAQAVKAVLAPRGFRASVPRPAGLFTVTPPSVVSRVSRRIGLTFAGLGVVAILGVGGVAASGAGGPLYGARLWVDAAVLPAGGTARVDGDLRLLDVRLGEARSATSRADANAVSAALRAYQSTAEDAARNATSDADRQRISSLLSRHLVVLEELLVEARRPAEGNSGEAIEGALDRAREAIGRLQDGDEGHPGLGPGGGPQAGPHSSSSADPAGAGDGNGQGGGGATSPPGAAAGGGNANSGGNAGSGGSDASAAPSGGGQGGSGGQGGGNGSANGGNAGAGAGPTKQPAPAASPHATPAAAGGGNAGASATPRSQSSTAADGNRSRG